MGKGYKMYPSIYPWHPSCGVVETCGGGHLVPKVLPIIHAILTQEQLRAPVPLRHDVRRVGADGVRVLPRQPEIAHREFSLSFFSVMFFFAGGREGKWL